MYDIKPPYNKYKHRYTKNAYGNKTQKNGFYRREYSSVPNLSMQISNAYQHLEPLKNIPGYVVNIYDAVNFDIDLYIPNEYKDLYSNVIKNSYTFTDMGEQSKVLTRNVLRCRLRGIQMVKDNGSRKRRGALCKVIQRIEKQNGWVICDLGDIDIYRRILIDIYDPITGDPINDVLLTDEYGDVFKEYKIKQKVHDKIE